MLGILSTPAIRHQAGQHARRAGDRHDTKRESPSWNCPGSMDRIHVCAQGQRGIAPDKSRQGTQQPDRDGAALEERTKAGREAEIKA